MVSRNKSVRAKSGKVAKTGKKTTAKKPAIKQPEKTAPVKQATYPHHASNPFLRAGSSYGACFNILAAHPTGLHKNTLIELLAKETHKDIAHAKFDAAVVLSARESINGSRHRSSKPGYYIKRTNDHVQLMLA